MLEHKWKYLFISLLALNIISFILFIILISSSKYDNSDIQSKNNETGPIQVVMDNQTVEMIINDQIKDDTMNVVVNEKEIRVNINYKLLKVNVPISVSIEPLVNGNDIILKLEDIDVGKLPISSDFLYDNLKQYIDLGPGVSFMEDKRAIVIDSKIFNEHVDYNVTISEIDYKNDKWYFSIEDLF